MHQCKADNAEDQGDYRLSWHLNGVNGGYRAGSVARLNENEMEWRKLLYYK